MKKLTLIPFLLLAVISFGQKAVNPAPFAKNISTESMKKHLYTLASKEMEGRETATEGQRKAAAYIENHFKSLGLLPGNNGSYQMYYPLYQDSLVKAAITVNNQAYSIDKDFSVSVDNNYNSSLLGSEVVYVGRGQSDTARDDYKGINVKGKIVLVYPGAPQTGGGNVRRGFNQFAVQEAAQKNGAAAVLVVQGNFPRRSNNAPGRLLTNIYKKTIYPNTYYISEKLAESILGADLADAKAGKLAAKTYTANVKLEFNKYTKELQSSNVVAVLEGTDKKDEYVFITGHYDHLGKRDTVIYYGADDDGSGTTAVLELASAFVKAKAAGKGPRRSIVFMTVSGEEKGLLGSEYYSNHPIFPMDKTTVDLNIDMIGRVDATRKQGDSMNYVYVVGDDKLSSDLKLISEAVNKKYTKMELDYKFNDPQDPNRIYYRSDHYNFARKGVPIIFYYDGMLGADYHRPTDTPDKIYYELMQKRAQLVFYTAWEMANRNDMLKRDIPLDNSIFNR